MYKETSSLASKDRNFQQTLRAISFVELTNNNTLAIVTTHVQNNAPNLMDLIFFFFFLGVHFQSLKNISKQCPHFFWTEIGIYSKFICY